GALVVHQHLFTVVQRVPAGLLETSDNGVEVIDKTVHPAPQFTGFIGDEAAGIQSLPQVAFPFGDAADDLSHASQAAGEFLGAVTPEPPSGYEENPQCDQSRERLRHG